MELDDIMLTEIRQIQKDNYIIHPHVETKTTTSQYGQKIGATRRQEG